MKYEKKKNIYVKESEREKEEKKKLKMKFNVYSQNERYNPTKPKYIYV